MVFWRTFVKQFALCYQTVVCLSVVYCGQTVGRIKMKLGTQVGLGPGYIVLDGYPAPLPPKGGGRCPQYLAYICCGQLAAGIKMPLGMDVVLGPGHFVLDGDPAPPPKGVRTPKEIYGPRLLWPNGWMDQDRSWYRGRPQPRRLYVRWGPSPSPTRGQSPLPQFLAYFYCGQTGGYIKMPLGTEVSVGLRDIVLDGDPAALP